MAKKNKGEKKKEKKERDKGAIITTIILVLLLIVIILGVFALVVKFDIAKFGSDVMKPILKDVPVLNAILPEDDDEVDVYKNTPYTSLEEAIDDIQKLQKENDKIKEENDKLKEENADNKNKVEDLTKQNNKLKKLEQKLKQDLKQEQEALEAKVKEYENEVVFGEHALSITEYQKYYESIDPERAEELYKQVRLKIAGDEQAKELADTISKMDTGAAAAALEELDDSIPLVCDVLLDMTEKNRAAIMNEMSPGFAAKVTKRMYSQTR